MKFQRYEKYKASGIDWLGEIPEGWEVKRLKDISDIFTGTTPSSLNPNYFFDEVNWFTPSDFSQIPLKNSKRKISKLAIKDNQAKLFRKNSVLLVSIGATLGKVSYSENTFSCNQQINPLTPKKTINYKYFFYYLYCSNLLIKSFSLETTLAILNQDRTSLIPMILPNKQTQTAIAKYLDKHTTLIDKKIKLLKAKKQSYTELKQSLINNVVCKGLNKSAEMKDSEIEWIGQIPKHWEVKRVKEIFEISRGRVIALTELEENGYPVYSSQTENDGCMGYIKTYDFNANLLTWTTDGVNAGTVFFRSGKFNCTNICGILLPKQKTKNHLEYLVHSVQTSARHNKRIDTNGAKIMSNEMAIIKIILPPKSEQIAIANYLDEKTSKIDQIVKKIDENILALQEFRKTLINDVVTGKVKVL